jgi:hypothetical protein
MSIATPMDAPTATRDRAPTTPNPAVEPPAITSTSHGGPPRPGIPPLRLRVLVVDDNRDAADILGGLLSLAGADVRVCYDAATAVAAVTAFRPDAGVFDVSMPGTDGCSLAAAVRAGPAPAPCSWWRSPGWTRRRFSGGRAGRHSTSAWPSRPTPGI